MGSYKLVTGSRPERYTPDKPALHGLTALLARHWNELVTTQTPSDEKRFFKEAGFTPLDTRDYNAVWIKE